MLSPGTFECAILSIFLNFFQWVLFSILFDYLNCAAVWKCWFTWATWIRKKQNLDHWGWPSIFIHIWPTRKIFHWLAAQTFRRWSEVLAPQVWSSSLANIWWFQYGALDIESKAICRPYQNLRLFYVECM